MAKKIWVVLQQREGELHRMSIEAIYAGQKLTEELGGGTVEAVLLGSGMAAAAEKAAAHDLAALIVGDHEKLADYTPGGYVSALAPAIRAAAPDFVIFPHTYQTVDYAPRLAQEIDAAVVPEAVAFATEDGELRFTRPILGGKLQAKVRVKGEGTTFISVQSGAFSADDVQAGKAEVTSLKLGEITPDREILGVEQASEGDTVDLTKNDIIIGVGRGLGDPEKLGPIQVLAKKLGAEIGASRPVVDSGWLDRDRQIGSSGQTVAPKLYLALGISGAIQHLVGMKGAKCIVAINKDLSAPLFNLAQYGIVGDLHEIVPALTEALEEAGL